MSKQETSNGSGLSRRDFLKTAAAGAVGAAAVSALGACTTTPAGAGTGIGGGTLSADSVQGAKWNFEIPPAPITTIAGTIDADVVVVGAGMAGLCTAVAAAQEGLKTFLVSGSSTPTQRGGSNHATYSRLMEKLGIPRYDVEKIYQSELIAASDRVDNKKWYRFYNKSEEAMNWLLDQLEAKGYEAGIEMSNFDFEEGADSPTHQPPASHCFYDPKAFRFAGIGQGLAVSTLEENFKNLGGTIYYKNVARQLVRGSDNKSGRVRAVIAQREDGSCVQYNAAKAVVLCTGDFSRDKDMMMKYCPWAVDIIDWEEAKTYDYDYGLSPDNSWGLFHGDGHKMGLWIGAAWQKTFPNAAMIQGNMWTCSNQPYGGSRAFTINNQGERYCNEDMNAAYGAFQQLRQPNQEAYIIWDINYARNAAPWYQFGQFYGDPSVPPEAIVDGWNQGANVGQIVKADSLDEVIGKLGLPLAATQESIGRYNGFCVNGRDLDFYKKPKYLHPIAQGPFYGAKVAKPVFYTVLGGLRTDEFMRVCAEDDSPVPGLYNVGTMAGDMFANVYNFRLQGHSYGSCLTFGYLTGKHIAQNE
jgi:succinate dehydrogenase/fumarate reductase flavoprotein subunit